MMCYFISSVELLIGLNLLLYPIQCKWITAEILNVYPDDLPRGRIRGTDPITMVFKDAVVPLDAGYSTTDELVFTAEDSLDGNDLPLWASQTPFWFNIFDSGEIRGRIRWVTTYIARFIIADTYTSDLKFTVETNPFFDAGINVIMPFKTQTWKYTTSSPIISARVFSSATAECSRVTGIYREVQPDAVIKLTSTVDMLKEFWDKSKVTDGFTMELGLCNDQEEDLRFDRQGWLSAEVDSYHKTVCVLVSDVSSELDAKFDIEFKQGVVYNDTCGLLNAKIRSRFSTLKPFTLTPIKRSVVTNKLKFNVYHGIGDQEIFQSKLESFLTVTPDERNAISLPFVVTVDKCSFTLEIDGIASDTTYQIELPEVKDYWGLPLQTRKLVFWTGSAPSGKQYPSSVLTFLPDEDLTIAWPFFAVKAAEREKKHTFRVDAFKVGADGVRDFMKKAPVAPSSRSWSSATDISKESYMKLVHSASMPAADIKEWEALEIQLEPSPGLYLIWLDLPDSRYWETDRPVIVQQTDLNVVVVQDSENGFLVWVTSFTSNELIEGAVVSLYERSYRSYPQKVIEVSEGVTDQNGLVYLQVKDFRSTGYVLVEYEKQYAVVLNLYLSDIYLSERNGVLTTDRSLYDIGETVNLWAIVRERNEEKSWSVPTSKNLEYEIRVAWNSDLETETYPVILDSTFGTLTKQLRIPNDELAYNGETYISLRQKGSYRTVASTTIMVAAPRIPTSSLSTEVLTPIVNLNGDAELQVLAILLTDTQNPIQGSEVKFYLTISDSKLGEHKELRSVTTDNTGSALLSEKIEDIFSVAEAGQTLSWEVEVIGPTGEVLLEEGEAMLELSEWKIEIDVSFAEFIIPGWPVRATLLVQEPSSYESESIQPTMVLYSERCDEDSELEEISCTGIECVFDLPEVASPFHLQASLTDPLGTKVTSDCVEIIDWTADDWEIRRINHLPGPQVQLDKDVYMIGDSVVIKFFNSFHSARALYRWGNMMERKTEISDVLFRGEQTKTLTIGEECASSCQLVVVLLAAKQGADIASDFPDFVNFSLYKERIPKSASDIVTIHVDATKVMEISITPDATEVKPGTTVSITINSNPFSQVLILAIDQSYLEVSPHSLPAVAEDFELDLKAKFGVRLPHDDISSVNNIQELWEKFKQMRDVNPFLKPCWQFKVISDDSNTRLAFIDQSNEMFMEEYKCVYYTRDAIKNYFPVDLYTKQEGISMISVPRSSKIGASRSSAAFAAKSTNDFRVDAVPEKRVSAGSATGSAIGYIRSNFDPNPLFKTVETNAAGKVTVNFKLPDDIATFEVRAISVNKDVFGVAEAVEVISSKPVSMQALQPLFVREEDQFDAGVTIALGNDRSVSMVVTRGEDETRSVDLLGTTPVSVIFPTADLKLGNHIEEYMASNTAGKQLDGLRTVLPVRNFMDAISVGSSMAVKDIGGAIWKEVISFPEGTSPVNVRVVAGNGFKASVQLLGEKFGNLNEDWITASQALGVITVNLLYELNGQEDIQYKQSVYVEKLKQFTTPATGLRWSSYRTEYISLYLNLHAVYFASLREDDLVSNLVPHWRAAAEKGLLNVIKSTLRYSKTYDDWRTIALAHLAFGREWKPPHAHLSRKRLRKNIAQATVEAKSYFCLAFFLDPSGRGEKRIAENILDELLDTVRVQGQTAYLTRTGSTVPYSHAVHGLIVSASVLRGKREGKLETNNILQKLAVYVSEGSHSCWYWNIFGTLHAIAALVRYDEWVGSTEGNPLLSIVESSNTLLKETISSKKPPVTNEWLWKDVWGENLEVELKFAVKGEGEVRLAISTNYIPALSEVPLSRGLAVNRVIQAYDRVTLSGHGRHLQSFHSGELYIVKIEVKTPDLVKDVFLDDYLPGGLEPLDPSLYELSGSSSSNFDYFRYWCWWCWIQTFDKDATFMADRVRWFASRLSAGTHEVSYLALANTPGIYKHPPANSWISEQPEVMGLSAGQISVVQSSNSEYELFDEHKLEFKSTLKECTRTLGVDEICNMATGVVIPMSQVLKAVYPEGQTDSGTSTAARMVTGKDGDRAKVRGKDGDRAKVRGKDGDRTKVRGKHGDRSKVRGKHGDQVKVRGKHGDQAKVLGKDGDRAKVSGKDGDRAKVRGKHVDRAKVRGKHTDREKVRGKHGDKAKVRGKHNDRAKVVVNKKLRGVSYPGKA